MGLGSIFLTIAITTAVVLMTSQEDATPIKEGHAATSLLPPSLIATHHRLGLHSSHMGTRLLEFGGIRLVINQSVVPVDWSLRLKIGVVFPLSIL